MRFAALTLGTLLSLAACGSDEPIGATDTSTIAPSTDSSQAKTDANGFPAGFAYPPGATVEQTTPQHSLYIVPDAESDAIANYWRPHLESLGFDEIDSTDISATYQRGTNTIQVTWNQAGGEVRGAANVLTP